jgi:hypothetical protein
MLTLALFFGLIALPAMIGLIFARAELFGRPLFQAKFRPGVPIVYRMQETSSCPSPDAVDVYPSEHGESYDYLAKRYWRVEEVLEDGSIVALTPMMEHQHLRWNDPNLRKANLIERLRYAHRFPHPA